MRTFTLAAAMSFAAFAAPALAQTSPAVVTDAVAQVRGEMARLVDVARNPDPLRPIHGGRTEMLVLQQNLYDLEDWCPSAAGLKEAGKFADLTTPVANEDGVDPLRLPSYRAFVSRQAVVETILKKVEASCN